MKKKKRKNSRQFNRQFKKRFFTKKSILVLISAFIILVIAAIGCQRQKERAASYEKTIEELSTDIQELEDTNALLEEEKESIDTDEFKEKMARERLGMIGEDEYSLQESEGSSKEAEEDTATEADSEEESADEDSGNEEPQDEGSESADDISGGEEEENE